MKRILVGTGVAIVVILVVVGALLLAHRGDSSATVTTLPPVARADSVVADGTVQPVRRAELAFGMAGRVSSVLVAEGDTVAAGQVLAGLDDSAAKAAVAAADADVDAAQAGVQQAAAGLAAAEAAVDKAQAGRDGISDGAADWRIQAADADVVLAQAQLQAAKADAAAADARLAAARARAAQADAALRETTISAPFAGTVVSVDVKLGDQVGPSIIAVRVADLSAWEIVTTDLDEASVESIERGVGVELTFDALPDVTAAGTVTEIGLVGRSYQGTTVYPVTVVPDSAIAGLRWGLTATVEIPIK